MTDTVSAAEANRKFSELLRKVRSGRSFVVTSHGKPVARILPAATDDRARARARERLFARLSAQKTTRIGRWSRDELYD
jgi:prevent-host-death family protein